MIISRLPPPLPCSAVVPVCESVVAQRVNTMRAKTFSSSLKFFVLLMALFFMHGAHAQYNCDSALDIEVNSADTYYIGDTELWFRFQATSETVTLKIPDYWPNKAALVTGMTLFHGECSSFDLTGHALDTFMVLTTFVEIDQVYYIKVTPGDSSGLFVLSLTESVPIQVYYDYDCIPECDNLVFNGGFEVNLPQSFQPCCNPAQTQPCPTDSTNWLFASPFQNPVRDNCPLINPALPDQTYTNTVCQWGTFSTTSPPQTPQIYPSGINNTYAFGWSNHNQTESITTNVFMRAGVAYDISFDYRLWNTGTATPGAELAFYTTPSPTIFTSYVSTISIPPQPTWTTTPYTIQFTPAIDIEAVGFFPALATSGWQNNFYIDNVKITPPLPQEPPIVTADNFICHGTTSITYTITNYDPIYLYRYTINGGTVQLANGNTFDVDLTGFSDPKIELIIWNHCEREGYHTAYFSCDPSTSLPVTMDHTFDHGDVINQTMFTGDNIFICGHVTTGQDVTFEDCNVFFAPMARLTVSPSTTLTLEYSNLTNGCDYFWDGVFAEDETASIIVKNNTTFSYAKNAIVSVNNSMLDVTDAEFTDNLIGIHIRKYNPFYLPDQSPDGTPLPPPHSAYIAGCRFELINATTASQFLNEFILPVLVPATIGIRIDTVYNITIGDDASVGKRNYFDGLAFGIFAIWSDITVVNGQFDDIERWHYSAPYVNAFNRPLEGAIHCNRPLVHAGSISQEMFASAITGRAIIGGHGLKGNYFNNCRHGIYAYKHQLIATNNHFDEQHYNAIFVDEGRHGCQALYNTISMKDPLWALNKYNNVSILFTRSIRPFGGISTDIIGNTINNTRIGIYVKNHSSNPQATCTKCTRIGSNQIYFNNTLIVDGSKSYYGIELLNGDFVRVAGNHIENQATAYSPHGNTSFPPSDSVLTGISVAQSSDAWIYDNHQIVKMSQGIRAVGVCKNSQFSCNDLINCKSGIYFYPNTANAATFISQQGWSGRASDNYWFQTLYRIDGGLVSQHQNVDWYFRGDNVGSNPYATYISPSHPLHWVIIPQPNTDADSYCVGLPFPEIGDDPSGEIREMRYGDIVRENLTFDVLEEEFEQMCQEYLYEILFTNPDVMNIGQPGDTLYQNFFNYLTNSTIAEFTTIREFMDEENFAQALLDNGQVIATTMIDQNRQLTNDIYLRSVAVDAEIDSVDIQALLAIALLTPYIGGDGVYAARAMLGIDADDYGLPYRKGNETQVIVQNNSAILVYPNPAGESITFKILHEELQEPFDLRVFSANGVLALTYLGHNKSSFTIPLNTLKPGIYFYLYTTKSGNNASGRFIKK